MKTISKILSVVLCLAMVVGFFVVGAAAAVYGGGGNSGAEYKCDFVELYNPTNSEISLAGYTLQYTSKTGTFSSQNTFTFASGAKIAANGYYLVQMAAGNGGTKDLPTPDAVGTLSMGAKEFKIALVKNSDTITGATDADVVDFLGAGGANEYEGSAAPQASNTTAVVRKTDGVDTNDNKADFTTAAPNPRNGGAAPCDHEGKTHTTARDAKQHWSVCECGSIVGDKVNHTFTNGVCSCGFIDHVAEPAVGKTYKLGLYQGTLDKFLYITGVQSGSYLATTENAAEAADVFVETVEGGWRFFVVVENVKTYIDVVPTYNESKEKWYYNATLVTEPTCTWTWNEEHDTFVTVMTEGYTEATEHYVGSYNDFNTLSSSKLSYAATSFPSHLYAAADHTHTLGDATTGETGHYQTCSICGYKTTETAHADANNDQKCDACGTNVACTHSWKEKTSDTKHWEECEKCHEKKGEADHTFTKKTSDAKHWEECTCGLKKGEAAHTFTEGKCSCGATDPNYKAPEATKPVIDTGVKDPKVGSSFKLGMYQENLKSYLYFNGKLDSKGYYLDTTDKYSEAVDVIVEAATGGYYLYFMDGTTKTYVDIYVTDTGYVNLRLAATPSAVYTWNSEYKTFTTDLVVGDKAAEPYYIGTYKEYKTFSGSKLSFAATSFPSHLYADEPAATGDNSVVSVAIAALLVSAMGVTALVMKKKSI